MRLGRRGIVDDELAMPATLDFEQAHGASRVARDRATGRVDHP